MTIGQKRNEMVTVSIFMEDFYRLDIESWFYTYQVSVQFK